jgi:hypothetical protein
LDDAAPSWRQGNLRRGSRHMLERLERFVAAERGYTELRLHRNSSRRLVMRRGSLIENSSTTLAGCSARVTRSGPSASPPCLQRMTMRSARQCRSGRAPCRPLRSAVAPDNAGGGYLRLQHGEAANRRRAQDRARQAARRLRPGPVSRRHQYRSRAERTRDRKSAGNVRRCAELLPQPARRARDSALGPGPRRPGAALRCPRQLRRVRRSVRKPRRLRSHNRPAL